MLSVLTNSSRRRSTNTASSWRRRLSANTFGHMAAGLGTSQRLDHSHIQSHGNCLSNQSVATSYCIRLPSALCSLAPTILVPRAGYLSQSLPAFSSTSEVGLHRSGEEVSLALERAPANEAPPPPQQNSSTTAVSVKSVYWHSSGGCVNYRPVDCEIC